MYSLKENFFNVDIKYPHEYTDANKKKIFNVQREISLYDVIVFFMIVSLFVVVSYNLIDSLDEKGYMIVIIIFILFCAILG
mgnify:CR=1 FL=1